MHSQVMTISMHDGKKDKFPPRNLPGWAFDRVHMEIADLYRAGYFPSFNHHLAVDVTATCRHLTAA